jgi:hypothetical protein
MSVLEGAEDIEAAHLYVKSGIVSLETLQGQWAKGTIDGGTQGRSSSYYKA